MHGHRWLTLSLLLSTVATQGCGGGGGGGGGGSGAPSYTLSGAVTLDGDGHSGATVSLTGPVSRTTSTDSTGAYAFANLPAGAYSVVPTLAGQAFDPGSAAVGVSADVAGVDFALVVHSLAGTVQVNGQGQAGVQVSVSGSTSATTTSGPSGEFSFPALLNGSYVVTPFQSGQTYSPSQRSVSVDGASSAGNDFAMDTYALSGRVTWNGSGYALGGTVHVTGDLDRSTDLDASGNYTFPGLPNGSYTLTPSVTGQSLSPSFLVRTMAGAPSTGNDFALVTYSVGGRVLDRGAGLPGVSISLTGAAVASSASAASGDYSFDGLLNGDYLVTPAHASLAFRPSSLGAVVSYASTTGLDFQTSPAEAPVFGTRPGTYADAQSVTLACATPGATIRYTTDGSAPSDAAGAVYAGPIAVTASTVIRAVAYRDGWVTSPEAAALFTISRVAVAAGQFHSLALRADGTPWAWGDNTYGQLGDGTTAARSTRVWVPGLWGATAVAAGERHSLALVGGTVWTWGFNFRGQLGDGTTTDRKSPAQVPGLAGMVGLAGGRFHSAALRDDGTVWTWGDNAYGQLGDGTTADRWTPVQVAGMTGIVAIAGTQHTLALAADGTVWAWGWNDFGQLGDGSTTQRLLPVRVTGLAGVVAVAAGNGHSMALTSDGTVWTWGAGGSGALGDGSLTDRRVTPGQVAGLPRTLSVSAGGSSCLALGSDGTAWSWGSNYSGQLGDGSTDDRPAPAQVPTLSGAVAAAISIHGLVVTADGSLWAFGGNWYGELGDATMTRRLTPGRVWGMVGPVELASGAQHTVVAKADGTVWGWGLGSSGQLGNGTWQNRSAPVRATGLSAVVAVAAGRWHTVALRGDGTVWAWGANNYLQLGDGTNLARSEPVQVPGLTGVVAVAAGGTHTLALRDDGTVWAWGYNFYGQVGDGSTADRSTPAQVSGLSGAFVAIAGGYYHSLAVKGDGTVWSWGFNYNGQVGDGSNTTRLAPVQIGTPTGMVRVGADGSHSGGLRSDGTVWGWGANGLGALGDGTTTDRWTPVQAVGLTGMLGLELGYYHAVARAGDQTVRTWGGNAAGQLGDGTLTDRLTAVAVPGLGGILAVSAGEQHTAALAGDGTVWNWGYNIYGQLGDGTTTNRPLPMTVTVP